MKLLKTTIEARAYSEEEAKEYLEQFRKDANEKGYLVGETGYKYKSRKKGEDMEGWLCKCVKLHDEFWDE